MTNSSSNIFSATPHLSREQMQRYISHRLTGSELHDVEKHLVDCRLCNDALEGMKQIKHESTIFTVTDELQKLAKKRKFVKRKLFSQFDIITLLVLVFLILFLIVVAVVFFGKN
jgi:hypothetical protein